MLGFDIIFAEPDRMNGDNVVKSLVGLDPETIAKLRSIPKTLNFWQDNQKREKDSSWPNCSSNRESISGPEASQK